VGIEPTIVRLLYFYNKPLQQLAPIVEITLEIRDRDIGERHIGIKIKIRPSSILGL
jgi:hypothetical protein